MIVSNFEIGRSPNGRGFQQIHYQLQVTNMADNEIEFLAETHVTVAPDIGTLLSNVNTTIINAEIITQLPFRKKDNKYIQSVYFKVASKSSALFELKQNAGEGLLLGYIVLRVPPIRSESKRFAITTQQADPVKVLLSASRVDTRNSFSSGIQDMTGVVVYRVPVSDWFSSQSIELSSGKAENEIEPEGFGITTKVKEFTALTKERSFSAKIFTGALVLTEENKIPALLDLLAAFDTNEDEIKALNELLVDNGAKLRVHHL